MRNAKSAPSARQVVQRELIRMTTVEITPIVESLAARCTGAVLAPGTPAYDQELLGFNLARRHCPAAVVIAESTADIAASVAIAAADGMRVAVKNTGHGAADAPADSILISTRLLDSVVLDPDARTATVGPGTVWQSVLDAAAPFGLAGLCGSAPAVGVIGYTLGGGLGPIARAHGFAADHVVSIEFVDATGTVRQASAIDNADVFWALRGGGALAIVTSMTFELFPIQTLDGGALWFDAADAPAVLRAWQQWVATLPETVGTSVALLNLPPLDQLPEPLRGRSVVAVRYADIGADGIDRLAAIRSAAPPIFDTVTEIVYPALGAIHADPVDPMPTHERSALLRELTADAIDALIESATDAPLAITEVRLLGGAVEREPAVPNAVSGRDAAFSLFTVGVLAPQIADIVPAAVETVLERMAPWGTGGSLLNFAGSSTGVPADRARAAWSADDYKRLVEIRRTLDPAGVFAPSSRW